MNINSVSQSGAVSNYLNSVNNTSAKTVPTAQSSDSVELSEGAQKFSALVKAAKDSMQASGTDDEVMISNIIAQLNQNSYQVSTGDILSSILGGTPSGSNGE